MEEENVEQEILLEPEYAIVSPVTSVNGKIGAVVLTTSDLENDSDYQTGTEVQTAIDTAIAGKQDTLTAGDNITIVGNVISATGGAITVLTDEDANYTLDGTDYIATWLLDTGIYTLSQDATIEMVVALTDDGGSIIPDMTIANEESFTLYVFNEEGTSHVNFISVSQSAIYEVDLNDPDIDAKMALVKNYTIDFTGATDTEDGISGLVPAPYANASGKPYLLGDNGAWIDFEDTFITQGTGSATDQIMSQDAVTKALNTKLDSADYVVDSSLANSTNPVQNAVLYNLLGTMPSDFFSGDALASAVTGTTLRIQNALSLDDVKMYGDTFQQTYSGKNLFNKDAAPQGGYLATYSALSTGVRATAASAINYTYIRYVMNVGNYVGQTLTLSATASASASNLPAINMGTCDADGNNRVQKVIQTGTGELTVSYTIASGDQYIYFAFYANQVGTAQVGDYSDYTDVQLELSATPTSYEPYTGGQPSPSPSYPQNIDVVTGVQNVGVSGKNLLYVPNGGRTNQSITWAMSDGAITANGTSNGSSSLPYVLVELVSPLPAGTYTFSIDKALSVGSFQFDYYDEDNTEHLVGIPAGQTSVTFTITHQIVKQRLKLASIPSGSVISFNIHAQLEEGSTATAYTPNAQYYTIDLGSIELCKIGNYQDYIYKSGGNWYVHKEIRKRTLNGSETWTTGTVSVNRFFGLDTGDGVFNNTTGNIVFSDKFYNRFGSDNNSIMLSANASTPGRMLVFINGIATNATDWKTWLSNNNILVYYPITTPTDTQITDNTLIGELEAVLGMTCYDETNVVVTSTNLAGALELVAVNANAKGLIYKARQ